MIGNQKFFQGNIQNISMPRALIVLIIYLKVLISKSNANTNSYSQKLSKMTYKPLDNKYKTKLYFPSGNLIVDTQ